MVRPVGVVLAVAIALAGCAANETRSTAPTDKGRPQGKGYAFRDIAKSDIDLVAELHVGATLEMLRDLAGKLYRRNPREWRNAGQPDMEAAVARIFEPLAAGSEPFPELEGRRGTEAILFAFDERYTGDRVLAFVGGLATMTLDAYNGKQEFFLPDSLDAQKLYNSARNLEVAAWLLAHSRRADGELYLLSNAVEGDIVNLSYERLFGKLIAQQDMMARIIADRYNRSVTKVIQSVAQVIFLPI